MVGREELDVGVVIPMAEEFEAFAEAFGKPRMVARHDGPVVTFYRFPGPDKISVVAVQCEDQGPERAAIAAERLLHRYRVRLLCQVGIAGSLGTDVKLGDVVVPSTVWGYHSRGKWSEDSAGQVMFEVAGEYFDADPEILEAVRVLVQGGDERYTAWQRAATERKPLVVGLAEGDEVRRSPICHQGEPLASGPFLMASRRYWDQTFKTANRRPQVVEMEAAGFCAARKTWQVPYLIVRGISDFADVRKRDLDSRNNGEWRRYAARNAAYFLHMVLPDCLPPPVPAVPATPAWKTTAPAPVAAAQPPDINSNDLLRVYRAAQGGDLPFQSVSLMVIKDSAGPISDRGVRHLLRTSPAAAAEAIRTAVAEVEPAGGRWSMAQRAAGLTAPEMTPYLADDMGAYLKSFDPELHRGAITALGRMAATGWAPNIRQLTTADGDSLSKLGGVSTTALARMFRHGESEAGRRLAGDELAKLVRVRPQLASDAWPVLRMRKMSDAQADVLAKWLAADHERLVQLAALTLGYARAKWAVDMLLEHLRGDLPAIVPLTALGTIGGHNAVDYLASGGAGNQTSSRAAGLARCIDQTNDPGLWAARIGGLLGHNDADVRMWAQRAVGLRADHSRADQVRAGLDDRNSAVRGAAALAGARLGVLTGGELHDALDQAVGEVEKALVRLARLHVTDDEAEIPEIATFFSTSLPLERLFEDDFREVLRTSGGDPGRELATALDWLLADG